MFENVDTNSLLIKVSGISIELKSRSFSEAAAQHTGPTTHGRPRSRWARSPRAIELLRGDYTPLSFRTRTFITKSPLRAKPLFLTRCRSGIRQQLQRICRPGCSSRSL